DRPAGVEPLHAVRRRLSAVVRGSGRDLPARPALPSRARGLPAGRPAPRYRPVRRVRPRYGADPVGSVPFGSAARGPRERARRARSRLRDRSGEDATELLTAEEASGGDAVAWCNALGLLGGGGRLVVGEDVVKWKAADAKAVGGYLASPTPDTVLALVASELKKDSALAKACAKAGDVLVYDVPKRRMADWVAKQFGDRGVAVDAEAARLLIEVVGEDPEELASEVDKIATWSGGDPVGTREIEALAA